MEFSKKLLYFSWGVTIVITSLSIWFSVNLLSTEMLYVALPLSWAETGTATGFYFWKAKNENRAKYAQQFLNDFAQKWDTETAIRLAEIVLKD